MSPQPSKRPPKRNERLQVMLSDVELKVIDAWRFNEMMPTRAAAIRALIRRGLEASGVDVSDILREALKSSETPRSDDIGIV